MEPVPPRGRAATALLPLAVAAVSFALVATGRPRRVGVDVPDYVANVVDGVWLHDHHLLPRLVGAASWAGLHAALPATTPEVALAWAAGAAGALCAALVAALVLGRTGAVAVAAAAGAVYAFSDVGWELSTMFELAHFATAPVLLAALALTDTTPRRIALAAVAVGVAVAFHLLSLGALVGLGAAVALAWRGGAPRAALAAPLLAAVVFAAIAQSLFIALPAPGAPPSTLLDWVGRVATPGHGPAPAPPWTLAVGLASACARGWLGAALAAALALAAGFGARRTPADAFLLTTSAVELAFASRIEPTNAEYFDVTVATLVILGWPVIAARLGRLGFLLPALMLWGHLAGPPQGRPPGAPIAR